MYEFASVTHSPQFVYVIHDPLYEKVLCVHDSPNTTCDVCRPIAKKRNGAYYLQEIKRKVKTNTKKK